ncbi:MAG TPA: hypothetical protein VGE77_11565 [Nocardioides sp.]
MPARVGGLPRRLRNPRGARVLGVPTRCPPADREDLPRSGRPARRAQPAARRLRHGGHLAERTSPNGTSAGTASAAPATSTEPTSCDGPGAAPPPDLAARGTAPDAPAYAESYDLTVEEASRRLHLQEDWGAVLEALRTAGLATFSETGIDHAPELALTVRLIGDTDVEAACAIVAPSGMASVVEIHTDAGLTPDQRALLAATLALPAGLDGPDGPVAGHGLGGDDTWIVHVHPASDGVEQSLQQALTDALGSLALPSTAVRLEVVPLDGPATEQPLARDGDTD